MNVNPMFFLNNNKIQDGFFSVSVLLFFCSFIPNHFIHFRLSLLGFMLSIVLFYTQINLINLKPRASYNVIVNWIQYFWGISKALFCVWLRAYCVYGINIPRCRLHAQYLHKHIYRYRYNKTIFAALSPLFMLILYSIERFPLILLSFSFHCVFFFRATNSVTVVNIIALSMQHSHWCWHMKIHRDFHFPGRIQRVFFWMFSFCGLRQIKFFFILLYIHKNTFILFVHFDSIILILFHVNHILKRI